MDLCLGTEQEFYENEAKEIILDVLESYRQQHPTELRRSHIIESILKANKKHVDQAHKRRQKIKSTLKGYSSMDSSLEKRLGKVGCTIMDGKKHYKIRLFGDTRYQVTMSKTGSDYRSGSNLAAEISKIMY